MDLLWEELGNFWRGGRIGFDSGGHGGQNMNDSQNRSRTNRPEESFNNVLLFILSSFTSELVQSIVGVIGHMLKGQSLTRNTTNIFRSKSSCSTSDFFFHCFMCSTP